MTPSLPARRAALLLAALAIACSDSVTAPADALPTGETTPPPPVISAAAPASIGTAAAPLRLTGGGFLTRWTFAAPHETLDGWATTILASNGTLVEDQGRCCRITGDTLLQVNYGETPAIGDRSMAAPTLMLGGADFRHYGGDDALLIIRESDNRMAFYVPVSSWTLEITAYTAPTEGHPGEIRGHASFAAVALIQERENTLAPYFLHELTGTTVVHADFTTPLRYQSRSLNAP